MQQQKNILTPREKEIIILICSEKDNKQIAADLNISVNTVQFHRGNIYRKIETKTLAGIVKYACKNLLITT